MVRRGLVADSAAAASLIVAGRVVVGGAPAVTPKRLTDDGEAVRVLNPVRFVGRGGDKLEGALDALDVTVDGARVLDVGSSTGGFTDCLLQRGAAEVVAVDVGTHQLSEALRSDRRVTVLEQTDVRALDAASVGGRFELVTVDVSFISLRAVMGALAKLVKPGGVALVLVKPQFEVSRSDASRGRGVIRSPELWAEALGAVAQAAETHGLVPLDATVSGVRGAKGNTEFFVRMVNLGDEGGERVSPSPGWVEALVRSAEADSSG